MAYYCEEKVDVLKLQEICFEEFYEELELNTGGEVGGHFLAEYKKDTYETLIKCIVLDNLRNYHRESNQNLFVEYSTSQNEKIKSEAEYALSTPEKSTI